MSKLAIDIASLSASIWCITSVILYPKEANQLCLCIFIVSILFALGAKLLEEK